MPKVTELTNDFGNQIVIVENEDGTIWSGLKSVYDEMQAAMPKQEWVEPQLTK